MKRKRETERWHFEPAGESSFVVFDDEWTEVAFVAGKIRKTFGDKVIVRPAGEFARKIAASPELLHAAKLVVARWEHGNLAEAVRMLAAAVEIADNGERMCSANTFCDRRARDGFKTCGRHARKEATAA